MGTDWYPNSRDEQLHMVKIVLPIPIFIVNGMIPFTQTCKLYL
jgi:hypothetical protein